MIRSTMQLAASSLLLLFTACGDQALPTMPERAAGDWRSIQAAVTPSDEEAELQDGFVFLFHDCTGPAGTPASFTAVKTELPDAAVVPLSQATAYRLTDGSAIFIALIRGTRHYPPGIDDSGIADTTCLVDTLAVGTLSFRGFLVLSP